jgi:hypothetical protein
LGLAYSIFIGLAPVIAGYVKVSNFQKWMQLFVIIMAKTESDNINQMVKVSNLLPIQLTISAFTWDLVNLITSAK